MFFNSYVCLHDLVTTSIRDVVVMHINPIHIIAYEGRLNLHRIGINTNALREYGTRSPILEPDSYTDSFQVFV